MASTKQFAASIQQPKAVITAVAVDLQSKENTTMSTPSTPSTPLRARLHNETPTPNLAILEQGSGLTLELVRGLPKKVEYKIVIVGGVNTGKTSVLHRYLNNTYSEHNLPTFAVDYGSKSIVFSDGHVITLHFWDTAGQERYHAMMPTFFRNVSGCLVVFDTFQTETMEAAVRWKKYVDEMCRQPDGRPIPCVLVSNKCDNAAMSGLLQPHLRKFAAEHGFVDFNFTSAKFNINIQTTVHSLVRAILRSERAADDVQTEEDAEDEPYCTNCCSI